MNATGGTSIDKVRVIGIFAHVDAGKTTASEAILYHTGRIHRVGRVDEGSAQLDWMEQERDRGITVTSAATTCDWRGYQINLIDTPGHIDFSAEVVRSIQVIDGAVIVLCGVGGVEPQTEAVWMHADRRNLPRIIFINKLDRMGADFHRVLHDVQELLTPRAVALQIPIGSQGDFTGVVGLISQQAYVWRSEAEGEPVDEPVIEPVPSSMAAQVTAARASLLDAICDTDDALLAHRLAGREPDRTALLRALRRATISGKLVPVTGGSALKRIGVQALLDAIFAYLPAPVDMPPVRGTVPTGAHETVGRPDDPAAPLCAVAFKIVTDPYIGHVTWVRVLSGKLKAGEMLHNPRADVRERVARIYRMHANKREQVEEMAAGDVVALAGVKSAVTGDTLCDPAHPIELEAFKFPEPVIMVAVRPASEDRRERLHQAVARLCNEDPTLIARFDPQTREQTLAGMGELHLEIAVDRLRTEFGADPQVGQPQVSYYETVRRTVDSTGTYRKQTGGHGHYAQVRLRVEPLERGEGIVFESVFSPKRSGPGSHHGRHGVIPAEFVRPIETGVRETLEKGIVAGYPVTDVRVTLLDGRCHEVDSSGKDFQIAGSMAVRQAVRGAQPALLEPVMRIDIAVSQEHLGTVTADIGRRRGSVKAMQVQADRRTVSGEVPLAEVRGYATDLRSLTHGRGTFVLEFRCYDFVPDAVAEQIIEQRRLDGQVPER